MMKWTRYMLLMPVLLVQALSSCSLIDEPEYGEGNGSVTASLAFTVSSSTGAATRMSDAVVQEQENGRSYRGLGNVYLIPFTINGGQVTSSDTPSRLLEEASLLKSDEEKTGNYGGFYLYNVHTLNRGINAFLVYGKARKNLSVPAGVTNEAYYGSLQIPESDLVSPDLSALRFSPDPIYKGTGIPEEAQLLADYLTYIAGASGSSIAWSNTTDPTLKSFYLNFTGQENNERMVMAGSTANVIAHVNALYSNIVAFDSDADGLINNILNRIQNPQVTGLTLISIGENDTWKLTGMKKNEEPKGFEYPASKGLPDGAAALQWGEVEKENNVITHEFVPRIKTTPQTSINNIDRYCYPPELFYYANSRINTSNEEIKEINYVVSDWNTLLAQKYRNENAMVTGNTQSVAIRQPLQYAVGRLKMSMKAETTTGKLKDAANKDVPLTYEENSTTKSSFPLTGVIICNQHPVGFDFKPVGVETHVDDAFIFDSQMKNSDNTFCYLTATEKMVPSTLVLQSYDGKVEGNKTVGEEITIILEFLNNSGQKFKGKGGVIYEGTKFYLIGKINPGDTNITVGDDVPDEVRKRVFTQDYVTMVNTKVETLANAYNVLPDLLGGRLEIGVRLTSNWIQAETTNVGLQ